MSLYHQHLKHHPNPHLPNLPSVNKTCLKKTLAILWLRGLDDNMVVIDVHPDISSCIILMCDSIIENLT